MAGSFYFMAEKTNEAIEALRKGTNLKSVARLNVLVLQAVETIPDPEFWKDSFLKVDKVYA